MMNTQIPHGFAGIATTVFKKAIADYQASPSIEREPENPYPPTEVEHLLYAKCFVDNVQWDMEDIIRDPDIQPVEALRIKRLIDRSNQKRTDLVEYLDAYFLEATKGVQLQPHPSINTESPAWALDRLSILELKLYHMAQQLKRADASEEHLTLCKAKLEVLEEQARDLCTAIDELLADICSGRKYMKVYKQMKMYNDPSMNPLLKGKKL